MDLNIKKAFLSPFSEKRWFIKLFFPFIVAAYNVIYPLALNISKLAIVLSTLLCILLNIILIGFIVQFQHNEIHNNAFLFPNLNKKVKNYFINGFKIIGITLLYFFFAIVLFFFFSGFLHFGGVIKFVVKLITNIGLVIFVMSILFSECSFADNFSFRKAVNFESIFKLMSQVKFEILLYVVLLFLLCTIKDAIFGIKNIAIIISPFIIVFVQLIIANFNAQLYKIAKNRLEKAVCETSKDEII